MKPVFVELDQDYRTVIDHFCRIPGTVFLDSSTSEGYSYLAFAPFMVMYGKGDQIILQFEDGHLEKTQGDPLKTLQAYLKRWELERHENLPNFQGGVAGYFGYDLLHQIENIGMPVVRDEINNPDMVLGFYDTVLAVNHQQNKSYLISTGLPGDVDSVRRSAAMEKAEALAAGLQKITPITQTEVPSLDWVARTGEEDFKDRVARTVRYIEEGDIYQANISLSYLAQLPQGYHPYDYYQKLRNINAAPFAAFMNFDDVYVLSASPERFLRIRNGTIEAQPIKGTRPRGKTEKEDQENLSDLIASQKDQAENLMIVDLLRNDLSKVCREKTVNVKALSEAKSFTKVHHLVSTLEGQLRSDTDAIDVLRAMFPGGSITGVPKIRAMQIISELEKYTRSTYCGSVGYISFNGNTDLNIAIRTLSVKGRHIKASAGGGITALSDPQDEYEEAMSKLQGLLL